MLRSIELLDRALAQKSAAQWSRDLYLTEAALSMARRRGRLSPTLAGNLALRLGLDAARWIAIAALEAEPDSTLLNVLKEKAEVWPLMYHMV